MKINYLLKALKSAIKCLLIALGSFVLIFLIKTSLEAIVSVYSPGLIFWGIFLGLYLLEAIQESIEA